MSGDKLRRQAVIDMALNWRGPMRLAALPAPKPRISVEALLEWAYLRELPKVPRAPEAPMGFKGAWDKVSEWAEELSLAGLADNRFGVVSDFLAQDLPHNDALIVHEAVCALDVLEVEGLGDFSPFAPVEGVEQPLLDACARRMRDRVMTVCDDGRARLRNPLRNLVFHGAIMRRAPEWRIDDFSQDVERWENGAVKYFKKGGHWEKSAFGVDIWVEYETAVSADPRSKRLEEGVEPRPVLSPDPTDDAVSRVNYELWRLALDVLAAELFGVLEKWEVQPSALPVRPWLEPAPRVGRILRVIRGDVREAVKKMRQNA